MRAWRRLRRPAASLLRAAAIAVSVCGAAVAEASDVAYGAYIRLPFAGSGPVFGLSATPRLLLGAAAYHGPVRIGDESDSGLHLQVGSARPLAVSLNGIPLSGPEALYQDAEGTSGSGQDVDVALVAGVVLGVGLIAAIANADTVIVSGCSGPNCPPTEKPPDKPDPEEPEAGPAEP